MSVTEYQRQQLLTWFEQHMGPELAPTMMELIPPTGLSDLATRRDLDMLHSRLASADDRHTGRIDSVEHALGNRIDAVEHALGNRIDAVEQTLNHRIDNVERKIDTVEQTVTSKIESVEHRLGGQISDLRAEMHAQNAHQVRVFTGMLLASQTAFVAIVTLLFTLMR